MTKRQNKIARTSVFYLSNGRWAQYRSPYTGRPRTFTSSRELNRFLNSYDFNYDKNYVLKSRVTTRKITSAK